jgi:molybdenum ABC transporter molybdate-binding protein
MTKLLAAAALLAAVSASAVFGQTQTERALLAPTGTLRVSFLGTNPVQGRVDPRTGAISGIVSDLTRELAKRLGVPYRILPVANATALIDSVRTKQADVGFLAWEAERAQQVEFSDPYALMGNAYLVRADSPLKRSADVDRTGVNVGTVKGQSQQIWVSEHLTQARIDMVPVTPPHTDLVAMLVNGQIDAFAANRQRMEEAAATSALVRVMPDNFSVVGQALVVEKGDTARTAILNDFVAQVIASGLVRRSLDESKVAGVEVATRSASELSVMSAGAMEAAVAPLATEFQRASGHTVTVDYGTAPELTARLTRGQPADVIIAPAAVIDQATSNGQVVPATRVNVGRIGVGVFVRTGAGAPDVSSESALRSALLAAEHIVYTQGSSGQYIDSLFAKLGVASQVASKLVRVADADTALARIAAGSSADLGFGAVTAIKAFEGKGTTYTAPLPDSLQNFTAYDAAVRVGAREAQAAAAFLAFLKTPAARRTLDAAGLAVSVNSGVTHALQ